MSANLLPFVDYQFTEGVNVSGLVCGAALKQANTAIIAVTKCSLVMWFAGPVVHLV